MDVRKIALIVVAMIVALGAAFGVNMLMRDSTTPQARAAAAPEINGPKVLVATRALPVGTIITADALRYQPWPEGLVKPDQYYLEESSNIQAMAGSVVRIAMTAGAPVTKGSLVNPRDSGFLASALGPGMRAVTVPLSPDQGVAGFVFPGDRVDLLLTLEVDDEQNSSAKLHTSETIVRNLRVLAVDQRSAPDATSAETTPQVFATVTLEVTPQIAEAIAVARSTGTISLALRSIADSAGELEESIANGSVSVPRDGDRTAEQRMMRGMASRPSMAHGGATTGGDVSRYLRRSLAGVRAPAAPMAGGETNTGNGAPAAAPAVPQGPVVRVTRGDQVTIVPVGR